ncbi:MAG: hypothetical protein QG670_1497 [Thermoproteota archaeon]|nr:hypothetical protein [Thermoproteota archaeon]
MSVALYDAFMMKTTLKRIAEDLSHDGRFTNKFSYSGEYFQLVIGEFLFYSTLPAHVNAYYESLTLIATLLLTGIGLLLNLKMLRKKSYVARITLPVFLGTLPIIFKTIVNNLL